MARFWHITWTFTTVTPAAVPSPTTGAGAPVAATEQAQASQSGQAAQPGQDVAGSVTVTWPLWQVQMLNGVNSQRAAAGLAPLALCYPLARAAGSHSDDQAAMGNMTHLGSDGSYLGDRADGAGYHNWSTLSENIAEGYTDEASVMAAWVASPDHLENMLRPEFTAVGFGQATSSSGVWYWTQDFGAGGTC